MNEPGGLGQSSPLGGLPSLNVVPHLSGLGYQGPAIDTATTAAGLAECRAALQEACTAAQRARDWLEPGDLTVIQARAAALQMDVGQYRQAVIAAEHAVAVLTALNCTLERTSAQLPG